MSVMSWPFSSPTDRSITMTRSGTPIWGAARPMPGAAYIVSTMSLTRAATEPSISVTGSDGAWSTGSPHLTISRSATVSMVFDVLASAHRRKDGVSMKTRRLLFIAIIAGAASSPLTRAQSTQSQNNPTWWDKFLFLSKNGSDPAPGASAPASVGADVDVSAECGPQSETYITLNPSRARALARGPTGL